MRSSAPFSRALSSLSGTNLLAGALPEIVPAIFPVAVVGSDHKDESRPTFTAGAYIPALAGQLSAVVLVTALNAPGAVRLQTVGFSGGLISAVDLIVGPWPDLTIVAPTIPNDIRATGPAENRLAVQLNYIAGGTFGTIESQANLTNWIPLEGTILEPGFGLRISNFGVNRDLRVFAAWRNA